MGTNVQGAIYKWIPSALVIASLALCFLNWTLLSGLEYGYFYGVFSAIPPNGFAAHGPNHFQSMNIWYAVISICFAVYLIAQSLKSSIVGLIIRVIALCVSIYPYCTMLLYKYEVLKTNSFVLTLSNSYGWLWNSVYIDVVCLIAITVVLGIEILRRQLVF